MDKRITSLVLATALVTVATAASAQNVTPNFASAQPTSFTDRYDPAYFSLVTAHGRDNVIAIGINSTTNSSNRPAGQQGTFYNTQGHQLITSADGAWTIKADLYVEGSWAIAGTDNFRRSDMWGIATDASNQVSGYPIIGFTNANNGTGQFREYNVNDGSWNYNGSVNYDAWNTLQISFDGIDTFSYYVNGASVFTNVELLDPPSFTQHTAGIDNMILQAYNFNDPALQIAGNTAYEADWSNPEESVTPEPASLVLMGTGLLGIAFGGYRRRRKA